MAKYTIRTATLANNAGVLSSTSLEVLDVTLVVPSDNAGPIWIASDASSGTGFAIAKGTNVKLDNVNLHDFTLSGASSDRIGFGYHR